MHVNKDNEVPAKFSYEFDVRAFKPFTDGGVINVPIEHCKMDLHSPAIGKH